MAESSFSPENNQKQFLTTLSDRDQPKEIKLISPKSINSNTKNLGYKSRAKFSSTKMIGVGLTQNMHTSAYTEVNKQLFSALIGKTSDLDWFMFETKIRQIILELIDPVKQKNDYLIQKETD